MKNVSIEKIELKIGNKTIPLSLEEAKELKDALAQLFPAPIAPSPTIIYRDYHPWRAWRGPYWQSDRIGPTLQFQ